MSTLRLVPKSEPSTETSQGEKVLAVLQKAVEDVTACNAGENTIKGVIVLLWHEYPDGTGDQGWIVAGLNQLETVGVLNKTIHDIHASSLDDGDPV